MKYLSKMSAMPQRKAECSSSEVFWTMTYRCHRWAVASSAFKNFCMLSNVQFMYKTKTSIEAFKEHFQTFSQSSSSTRSRRVCCVNMYAEDVQPSHLFV